MKVRQPPDVHCHFRNMWTHNKCRVLICTLGVNEDQVASDIHFRLRQMWISIGHSIITFTWVEGCNWVATWYSTLLEMQVCIKWWPNTYPCLKHKWTSHGRPMLTLDWDKCEYWVATQYSDSADATSSIEQSSNLHRRLRCGSRFNGHWILWSVWDVGRHLSHDI
jgi:hypothetical protein